VFAQKLFCPITDRQGLRRNSRGFCGCRTFDRRRHTLQSTQQLGNEMQNGDSIHPRSLLASDAGPSQSSPLRVRSAGAGAWSLVVRRRPLPSCQHITPQPIAACVLLLLDGGRAATPRQTSVLIGREAMLRAIILAAGEIWGGKGPTERRRDSWMQLF
jgi:hypothetical protein